MAGEMGTTSAEAVNRLTLGLRESKQVLGRTMASWMMRAPSLETDIALAAIAQEELGHAQVLAGIYGRIAGDGGKKDEASDRVSLKEPVTHPAVRPFEPPQDSWPEVVGLLCLWDTAVTAMLESLASSSFAPLRHVAPKMCQEEAHHWLFARAAATDLFARGPGVSAALRTACENLIPKVNRWFEDIADVERLRREGVIADGLPLVSFASKIGPILEGLQLDWPARQRSAAK